MKKLILLFVITLLGATSFSQDLKKLNTFAYDWNKLEVQKTKSGERR